MAMPTKRSKPFPRNNQRMSKCSDEPSINVECNCISWDATISPTDPYKLLAQSYRNRISPEYKQRPTLRNKLE